MSKEINAFVRTEGAFPSHDALWVEAKEFLERVNAKGRLLAPFEFSEYFKELFPVQFSYFKAVGDFDAIVINKAQVHRYCDEFVGKVQTSFQYAFGNPVFNVYLKEYEGEAPDSTHIYTPTGIKERIKRAVNEKRRWWHFLQNGRSKVLGRSPTIAVVSASKFGNAGDDAITEAAVKIMGRCFKNPDIRLARPPFKRADIDGADIVVLGGGGVLYDSCFNNAMNYCDYLLYAKSKGKLTLGIGLGTQGIKSLRGRELYKNALSDCELVVVRNKRDEEVLVDDCGVQSKVITTNDIVFSLGGKHKRASDVSLEPKKGRLAVAISLLDSKNLLAANVMKGYREGCLASIEYLCANHDVTFVVQSRDDLELYENFIKKYGSSVLTFGYGNADRFIDFYKTVDLSVTSRFHGYIFSLLAGVPIIAVGSNAGKIDRLIKAAILSGKPGYIPLREFTLDSFLTKFNRYLLEPKNFIPQAIEVREAVKSADSTVKHVKKAFR